MFVGVIVPQGWTGEYDGWPPASAWRRTVEVANQAEQLGFESIWMFDHFTTVPEPTDEITFECFSSLSALASTTTRVRLGQIVTCTAYRNPALTAKMISTMDVISGGRIDLGIGAGWKRDEYVSFGYPYPETRERLAILADHLEVISRMVAPGKATHASFEGKHASVIDAINVPKPLQQPRVPIMVGGNGPNVTWRLAAKYADELNLDGLTPAEVRTALPLIAARCEEIGRDPASLRISVHMFWRTSQVATPGQLRRDHLAEYLDLGVHRVMGLLRDSARRDESLEELAEDARAAGATLA